MGLTRLDTDVLVIGAGAAGLACARAAHEAGRRVLVWAKDFAGAGDSKIATGLLAVPEDADVDGFSADLMRAGRGLSTPALVAALACEAAPSHRYLRDRGLRARGEAGLERLSAPMGGHGVARTAPTPGGGGALVRALAQGGPAVHEDHWAVALLVEAGQVLGALALDARTGTPTVVSARAVVLATGGIGHLFHPHSDQMRSCTGDGLWLGARAGVPCIDLEQVQFTPFALVAPAHRVGVALGGAALAGEDGELHDAHGSCFLDRVGQRTRGEVTGAIARVLEAGGGTTEGGVWLTPRPRDEARWRLHWAKALSRIRQAQGGAAARLEQPWLVAPTAHDHMGGLLTDAHGRTTVRALFAVGQVQGGLFGADRLGSTALPAAVVFGRRAGAALAGDLPERRWVESTLTEALEGLTARVSPAGELNVATLTRSLQRAAWQGLGPARTAERLTALVSVADQVLERLPQVRVPEGFCFNSALLAHLELEAMAWVARHAALAALLRTRSLGAHLRLDEPHSGCESGRTWAEHGGVGWRAVEEVPCGW